MARQGSQGTRVSHQEDQGCFVDQRSPTLLKSSGLCFLLRNAVFKGTSGLEEQRLKFGYFVALACSPWRTSPRSNKSHDGGCQEELLEEERVGQCCREVLQVGQWAVVSRKPGGLWCRLLCLANSTSGVWSLASASKHLSPKEERFEKVPGNVGWLSGPSMGGGFSGSPFLLR